MPQASQHLYTWDKLGYRGLTGLNFLPEDLRDTTGIDSNILHRQMRVGMQVKGKRSPVQAYSVAPLPDDPEARQWDLMGAESKQQWDRAARRRRRKRASIIVTHHLQAKSGAKMKPLIGRQQELEKVQTRHDRLASSTLSAPKQHLLQAQFLRIRHHLYWQTTKP